jgi:hypothetical protein
MARVGASLPAVQLLVQPLHSGKESTARVCLETQGQGGARVRAKARLSFCLRHSKQGQQGHCGKLGCGDGTLAGRGEENCLTLAARPGRAPIAAASTAATSFCSTHSRQANHGAVGPLQHSVQHQSW